MISGLFTLPLASAVAAEKLPAAPAAERFIAGPENVLVRALASTAVANPPTFNPLVLYGPLGVGKTSLAHSLAAQRRDRLGLKDVLATTAADLARGLAHAIEIDSVADFRTHHHRCDLLFIDEVHRLVGKAAAQQFFLSALDALIRRGTLVIATLRQQPQATAGLAPALISRLSGGLVVPLAPPGPLARRELVRQMAATANLPLNGELIEQLSGTDDESARRPLSAARLRHLVLQLAATARNNGRALRTTQITRVMAESSPEARTTCRHTISLVGKHFGLSVGDLKGKSRQQAVVEARGLAIYLTRMLTGASYSDIGRQFGSRDHTTALHACRKVAALVAHDETTRRLAEELAAQISAEGGG